MKARRSPGAAGATIPSASRSSSWDAGAKVIGRGAHWRRKLQGRRRLVRAGTSSSPRPRGPNGRHEFFSLSDRDKERKSRRVTDREFLVRWALYASEVSMEFDAYAARPTSRVARIRRRAIADLQDDASRRAPGSLELEVEYHVVATLALTHRLRRAGRRTRTPAGADRLRDPRRRLHPTHVELEVSGLADDCPRGAPLVSHSPRRSLDGSTASSRTSDSGRALHEVRRRPVRSRWACCTDEDGWIWVVQRGELSRMRDVEW